MRDTQTTPGESPKMYLFARDGDMALLKDNGNIQELVFLFRLAQQSGEWRGRGGNNTLRGVRDAMCTNSQREDVYEYGQKLCFA